MPAKAPPHLCHARPLCKVPVPPRLLFCNPHWQMVPAEMQKAHWAKYRIRYESREKYQAFLRSLTACVDFVKARIQERQGMHDERRAFEIKHREVDPRR